MKAFPCTFRHFMDLAEFGQDVVAVCLAKRELGHARHYVRETRAWLDRAERAARREATRRRRLSQTKQGGRP